MRRTVMWAALTATACTGAESVMVDVPDEVTVVGLVVLDERGQVREGTSLQPWGPSLPVVGRTGDPLMVLGYTEAMLAPYPVADRFTGRLRPALGCANRLPTPAYAAYVSPDGVTPVAPEQAPPVTAAWVEAACDPALFEAPWAVDLTCEDVRCAPPAQRIDVCTVALDLASCGGGELRVTVDARGTACAEVRGRSSACRPADDGYADASLACGPDANGCRAHVYRDARAGAPPFSVFRAPWRVGPPKAPTVLSGRAWIGARFLRSGYAFGLTVLSETVVISGPADPDLGCSEYPSVFHFVDQDTLAVVGERVAGPCAQALTAEAGGETFLAAYLDGDVWRVGRFDRTGDELSSEPAVTGDLVGLRDAGGGLRVPSWRPQAILLPPGRDEVWLVMYDSRGFEPLPGAALVRLDASSLRPRSQQLLPRWHRSFSAVVVGADELALLAEWSFSVGWFGVDQARPSAEVVVSGDSPIKNVHYTVTPLSADLALVAALGRAPAVVVGRMGEVGRAVHPGGELEQMMVDFVDWTAPLKLGIGLQTVVNGKREAIATLIDPAADRFLPGVWVLGDGLPSAVATDDRGRVYVLLPWTAELVRIDPAPALRP